MMLTTEAKRGGLSSKVGSKQFRGTPAFMITSTPASQVQSATKDYCRLRKTLKNTIDPWRDERIWHNFTSEATETIPGPTKDVPRMNLDYYIDIFMGSLLRFMNNPQLRDACIGKPVRLSMKDIKRLCMKTPTSIRKQLMERLEKILNREGHSTILTTKSTYNAEHLAELFRPTLAPTEVVMKEEKLYTLPGHTIKSLPTMEVSGINVMV